MSEEFLGIRIQSEMKKAVIKAAKAEYRNVTSWILMAIRERLDKKK